MNATKVAAALALILAALLISTMVVPDQGPLDADEPAVYAGEKSLTSVYIPETATSISAGAFIGCESLRFVTIPSTVTSIGAGAFSGCPSLVSLTFIGGSDVILKGESQIFENPSGVTIINATDGKTMSISSAMVGGSGISEAETGAAMVYDGGSWAEAYMFTFDGNSVSKVSWRGSYRGTLVMPSNVDTVCNGSNNQMFGFDKDWIESVVIPDGVTTIGNNAFSGCAWIESSALPPSVISIGKNAFANCKSLTSIELPNGLRTIGWNAFMNCVLLEEIAVPIGVSDISGAFQGCSALRSVSLPFDLKSIGESAFQNCRSLPSLKISDGIESIGPYAFFGCSMLESASLPASVRSIGERAFEGCTAMSSAELSEGLETIGARAFASCESLSSICVPSSTGEIGKEAFSGCPSLKSIQIDRRSTLTISGYAFPQNAELSVDFYAEDGTLLTSNYYKHGTFQYQASDKPGFHRSSL